MYCDSMSFIKQKETSPKAIKLRNTLPHHGVLLTDHYSKSVFFPFLPVLLHGADMLVMKMTACMGFARDLSPKAILSHQFSIKILLSS